MKLNTSLSVIALVFISVTAFCQNKKYIYYFDKDLNPTTEANSLYLGIGIKDGNAIELKCFNQKNKGLIFINHYTDSSLTVMHGLFQSYYNNGYQELEGNYANGKQEGLWEKWDTTGKLVDSSIYEKGERILWTLYNYDRSGLLRSFVLYDLKNPALDKAVYYDVKGNIVDPATINRNNDTDIVFTKAEIEASFPGGDGAWTRYITQVIQKDIDRLTEANVSGTCKVRFIVNKMGAVSDVKAITMQGSRLANVAVKAITEGPRWIPAMQNGRAVNAYREQPITFTIYIQ